MRLILTLFFASVLFCRAEEIVSGRWEGAVQIPERELKLIVDLAQSGGDKWTGSIIIPGLGLKGTGLADIAVNKLDVSFAIKGTDLHATFKGVLNVHGALVGDFVQAGNVAPFVLKKAGPAQVEVPAKSTPVARELEGEWKGEYELFGYPRKVTIKLANRGTEGATADFVIVGRKVNNLPVDLVMQEGDLLTIDSHEAGISYEGRFKDGEIQGTFIQGPLELPLLLKKTQ